MEISQKSQIQMTKVFSILMMDMADSLKFIIQVDKRFPTNMMTQIMLLKLRMENRQHIIHMMLQEERFQKNHYYRRKKRLIMRLVRLQKVKQISRISKSLISMSTIRQEILEKRYQISMVRNKLKKWHMIKQVSS